MRSHADNPFLQGNYAPTHTEHTLEALEVQGKLPDDLDGVFLRNGPNPRFMPPGTYHWFDGDGMAHAIQLRGGRASYRNRWVRSREFLAEEQAGRALWGGLEDKPDLSNPHGFMKNRSNTSFVYHGGKLLSLWEGGPAYELDLDTLETRGREDFGGKLRGPFTAHPKVDPATGEMFAFSYSVIPPYLRYFVFAPDGTLEQEEAIHLEQPVMMHDFAITENFVIFFDLPAVMRLDRMMQGKSLIAWEPERGARLGVMPRYGRPRELRWFEVPPFYMYHAANAYEEGRTIVLTGGRLSSTTMIAQDDALAEHERDPDADVGKMWRFRIDLAHGKVTDEPLDDAPLGFENVSEARVGHRARYNYGALLKSTRPVDGARFAGLRKFDLETGKHATHRFEANVYGGEGVFVPKKRARTEDDGYMLVLVHDEGTDRSELRVLDALRFDDAPIATVRVPVRVPYGFHARFIPR